jgi:hypothetical protein
VFFRLASWELALLLFGLTACFTLAGFAGGRYLRVHSQTMRESYGVLQSALLGVVGLVLAFGLSLAVGRYEDRRAATVAEANAIGTTYLRRSSWPSRRGPGHSFSYAATPIWRSRPRGRFRAARP